MTCDVSLQQLELGACDFTVKEGYERCKERDVKKE